MNLHLLTTTTRRTVASVGLLALLTVGTQAADDTCENCPSFKSVYSDVVGTRVNNAFGDDSLVSALLDGTPTLQLQLGYEFSDLDGNATDAANGLTLRSRVAYKTKEYKTLQAFVQWQHVNNVMEEFSFPGGGDAARDGIADPDGNRIHQAYLDFTGISDTKIRFGLQEVILDDARLIGNIGWRQNAQSFLGVMVENKSIENLTLKGAYLSEQYTILKNTNDIDSLILLNAKYQFSDEFALTGFAYLDDKVGASDTATYGLTAAGSVESINYSLTAAFQDDYQDSVKKDAHMINAALSTKVSDVKVGVGYSYISGGAAGDQFATIYGTAHAFNGWADQFLGTTGGLPGGLQDYYIHAGTKVGKATIAAFYHRFYTTDTTAGFDGLYGQELDAVIKYPICKHVNAMLKYALYDKGDNDAGNLTADEQVLWARLQFNF